MNGVNRVILIGNLGKDPEIKTLENGTKYARVNLATNQRYTAKNGDKITKTEWHNIVMWRGLAEAAEKVLTKGSLVYLEGQLRSYSYNDKEGNAKYTTDVQAENFTLLHKIEGSNSHASAEVLETVGSGEEAGDLPF